MHTRHNTQHGGVVVAALLTNNDPGQQHGGIIAPSVVDTVR